MIKNEIVNEVRKIREEYASKFNYDIKAIVADIRKKEKQESRRTVVLSRKRSLSVS